MRLRGFARKPFAKYFELMTDASIPHSVFVLRGESTDNRCINDEGKSDIFSGYFLQLIDQLLFLLWGECNCGPYGNPENSHPLIPQLNKLPDDFREDVLAPFYRDEMNELRGRLADSALECFCKNRFLLLDVDDRTFQEKIKLLRICDQFFEHDEVFPNPIELFEFFGNAEERKGVAVCSA